MRITIEKQKFPVFLLMSALVLSLAAAADAQVPSFSKSFNPSTIGSGSVSTLRFDIVNGSGVGVRDLAFTDTFPAGMTLASPANASTTCSSGAVSAAGSTVSLSGGNLPGGSSCRVTVNVTATVTGTNVSGDLTSSAGNSGSATATLTVDAGRPGFSKSFSPAAVFFGGRSRLTFTIDHTAGSQTAFNMVFTDNLPPGMTVASPANASKTCTGGLFTATAGSTVVSYGFGGTGTAQLPAGASCTLSVDVVGGAVGVLGNTSGELISQIGTNFNVSSGKAAATLTVTVEQISLTKEFTDDPATPGGAANLRFTVRNLDRRNSATNISFTDDLDAALSGLQATALPSNPCGAGSSIGGTGFLTFSSGNLPAEGTCTFDVTLSVPAGAASGSYTNTTSAITADVGGVGVVGDPASDDLFVTTAPLLTKTFLDDPAAAGGSVTLEFSITNTSSTSAATDIAFSDFFVPEITGASSVPAAGFCGAGSDALFFPLGAVDPARLFVTGASLGPGASCTFSVVLEIGLDAVNNIYDNTTSEITATVDGETVTGNPASDSFVLVAAPRLSKEFIDDPAAAGGTVTLQFTLTHSENALDNATDITFTDDLGATLAGLAATGLPQSNICGGGSQIDGATVVTLTGGSLAPGESCTFDVTLDVPATATAGLHNNTTSTVLATVLGVLAPAPAAADDLRIAGLTLTKEFTDDPVIAGGTVTLEFTLANSSTIDATDVMFVDDLDATVDNMTVVGLPGPDPCGAGSSLTGVFGNQQLMFSASLLPAGASCTFAATLLVPASTDPGDYTNVTELLSAVFAGETVFFDNARDFLNVVTDVLVLDKEFLPDTAKPGDDVTLRFTLGNLDAGLPVTNVAFTDDLDAVFPGLAATGTPFAACNGTVSGTSVISFSGGSLAPSEVCSFDVTVAVPATTPLGTSALNLTSLVTGVADGLAVSGAAAADVLTISALRFSKSFSGAVDAGDTVVLTFTIENLDPVDPVADLDFSDDLDAVVSGLAAIDTPKVNVCGAGSTLTGSSLLELQGGNLLPGGSCTFDATLEVPAGTPADDYLNVTSELRQGGTASVATAATATLTVNEAPLDGDGDGVLDVDDVCADTVIPEGVPTQRLGVNRFALVDDDTIFDTTPPNGQGPQAEFTTEDTAGCSCEQIIEALGLGNGHRKFGCSLSAMRDWVAEVSKSARNLLIYRWILDHTGKVPAPKP